MEELRTWFLHWLPLIQGPAALVSIGGAVVSGIFARNSKRAREEMTQNIVAAGLTESFEKALKQLQAFRQDAVDASGRPNLSEYVANEQRHKQLLEDTLASARAATPYLKKKPSMWVETVEKLTDAAFNPTPSRIEIACKFLGLTTAELKLSASTRAFSSQPHK